MGWKDILFLLGLLFFAVFVLYRAFRKKKWCPAIFGTENKDPGDCADKTSSKP